MSKDNSSKKEWKPVVFDCTAPKEVKEGCIGYEVTKIPCLWCDWWLDVNNVKSDKSGSEVNNDG